MPTKSSMWPLSLESLYISRAISSVSLVDFFEAIKKPDSRIFFSICSNFFLNLNKLNESINLFLLFLYSPFCSWLTPGLISAMVCSMGKNCLSSFSACSGVLGPWSAFMCVSDNWNSLRSLNVLMLTLKIFQIISKCCNKWVEVRRNFALEILFLASSPNKTAKISLFWVDNLFN